MLGFGALKAMNDTMRQNRDLLKANKKKPFEKTGPTRVTDNLLHNDKKLSDAERIRLVQAIWKSNRGDTSKQILGLVISIALVGALVATLYSGGNNIRDSPLSPLLPSLINKQPRLKMQLF